MRKKLAEKSLRTFEKCYKKPLNDIFNAVAKLEGTNQDDAVLNYTQRIKGSGIQLMRASKLVADYTRLSNGLYRHHPQCIDVVRFVRGIVRVAAPYALQKGIGYSYKFPSESINTITEIGPLTAILGHLLSNACRFTMPGNGISVDLLRRDDEAFIFVWDRGSGIPESVAPHIFEPYYSYDASGAPFAGNGLGLTLAKGFAQFLGGNLDFAPNGKGTFFVLTIPLRISKRPRLTKPPIPKEEIRIIMSDALPLCDQPDKCPALLAESKSLAFQ